MRIPQCVTPGLYDVVATVTYDDGDEEWLVTDPEDCLELLSELRELKDEVVVQWPKGETIKVTSEVGGSKFKMRIQKDICGNQPGKDRTASRKLRKKTEARKYFLNLKNPLKNLRRNSK